MACKGFHLTVVGWNVFPRNLGKGFKLNSARQGEGIAEEREQELGKEYQWCVRNWDSSAGTNQ